VGVNDDAAKDASKVGWFYPTMGAEGLQVSTVTLRWDETAPTVIPDQASVTRAISSAAASGQSVELDLYPLHSMAFTDGSRCTPSTDPNACGDTAAIQAFGSWVGQVARAFPTVRQFVVMNECNQPLFVNPQFDTSGANQSAEICGRALAAGYYALKAVSPQLFVWGVGLSPRGNDLPNAASNVSTSPVKFLQALGAWFKASGRTRPLMDGLDFHPYPIPQSLPFGTGYTQTTDATVSNLPRIYQAFYDGFAGSAQPTIGQQPGGGLPLSLNEVGIQTDSTGRPGYVGSETAANAAGGVLGVTATEDYQSSWYLQMLQLVSCDPNVKLVNIYHLLDEAALSGWQSGLYYVDQTPKKSAATVHDWIASTVGNCRGAQRPWTPPGVPARPSAPPPAPPAAAPRIAVTSGGRVRVFDADTEALRRVIAPFGPGFTAAMPVAAGDVNHDGVADYAAAGGGSVKILNGKSGAVLTTYPVRAVSVALGDVNGDGRADLVVGTASQVKVFDAKTRRLVETLTPFAGYKGGGTVASGDLDDDGGADVIAGQAAGGNVVAFSGASSTLLETLRPFSAGYVRGIRLAAGDVNGDGRADVIAGTGAGTTAVIRVFSGPTSKRLASFAPFGSFSGGISVAWGAAGLVAGQGPGGGAQVSVFNGSTGLLASTFLGDTGSGGIGVAAG